VKVLAGLRTDEHQAPQDGRFRYAIEEKDSAVDMRVSIAPTYHGENIVLRLLSDNAEHFTLEMLGFSKSDAKKIKDAIARPNGMILSTGPTGSGKTTTLYTLVKMLNAPEVSIVTIEETLPEEEVGEEIPEEEVTNSGEEEVEPSQEEVSEEEAEEEEEVEEPLEETSVSEPAPEA
jgi:type IV pilus assembly protein PilB